MRKNWEQVEADLEETRVLLDEVATSVAHLEGDIGHQQEQFQLQYLSQRSNASSNASSQSSLLENNSGAGGQVSGSTSNKNRYMPSALGGGRFRKAAKFLSVLTHAGRKRKDGGSNGGTSSSDVESPRSQNVSDLDSGGEEDKLMKIETLVDIEAPINFPADYISSPSKKINQSQVHSEIYNESLKPQDFQVCVTIIEARQLSGLNMDPVVCVQVGNQQKYTSVKGSTNCPYYNEYFVFEFHLPPAAVFDQIITLTVYHSRRLLRKSAVVGSFKLDVGTVHAQTGHQFYQKWAVLTDPTDVQSGAKGYLRCNIAICSRGETLAVPPHMEKDDDDIEANLLLPEGIRTQRQQARYIVRIHRADGLPSLNSGVVASVKRALTGDPMGSFLDPFVQVFFAGHTGRTTVQKGTSNPIWNEQIIFTEMFPPLVRRIKIQIRDSDSVNSSLIATHYLDFASISDEGRRGYLPTFGPCFIHMYGSSGETSVLSDRNAALSEGIGEGVAYKGRLLISLKVDVLNEFSSSAQPGVCVEPCPSVSDGVLGLEEEFLLFACILDVSMLDKRLVDKTVSLQLSIGNIGVSSDGQPDTEPSDSDWLSLRGKSMQNRNATPSVKAITNDSNYAYLPYTDDKPCLYIWSKWPDQRRRLLNSNVLRKMSDSLRQKLQDLEKYLETSSDKELDAKFHTVIDDFSQACSRYLMFIRNVVGERSSMNKLDKERYRTCQNEIDRLSNHARNLRSAANRRPLFEKLGQAYIYVETLRQLSIEPQDSLPDAFLWLFQGNKRVAYHRFSAQDLLYSSYDESRGSLSGDVHSFYFKVPGRQSHSEELWRIHGHVTGYIWLGSVKDKKTILDGLPKGYTITNEIKDVERPNRPPPKSLEFKDKNNFELRCHLFQARSLIGSDSTGLSDPFARVVFAGYSATTQVIEETVNPTWDELLVLPSVTLYGAAVDIATNPPSVVVEIFDQDKMGKKEFIGQALAQPLVKMVSEKYAKPKFPPALQWVQVYRGAERGGELLCAFELLQLATGTGESFAPYPLVKAGGLTENSLLVIPVPDGIRPTLCKFRIEVLFWGLRDLKRVNFVSVDKPRIDVECGGYVISSITTQKNPNFSNLTKHLDIDLPENPIFWPPLIIRCVDFRHFGRFVLIGTNTINSIDRFMYKKSSGEFLPISDATRQQSIIVDVDGEPALLLADSRYTSDIQINRKKVESPMKQENPNPDEIDSLDWWSKYFASIEELLKENQKSKSALAQTLESCEDATFNKNLYVTIGTDKKRKHNGASSSKKVATKKKPLNHKCLEDVAKLKIYTTELEAVEEFNKFNDWLGSFELYRGKKTPNVDNSRCVGRFKGAIRICQHPLPVEAKSSFFKQMPSNDPMNVLVRVYVVKANDLHPADINGKADPYCVVTLGKTKINDKDSYISKQLNPIFGKCFEIEATFPLESQLCVQVYDWDLIGMDDLIGETWIDLENRFYSRHRATCGLALQYETSGYNKWRDPFKPSQILLKLCKENKLEGPFYMPGQVRVGSKSFHVPMKNEERLSGTKVNAELLALYALHHWAEVPRVGCSLVLEHVERRPLYHPDKPGIVQGSLEMWVDMFSMDMPIPGPSVEIAPRKPKSYELRIIIWNTEDVVLEDDAFFTGEKMSDIYVKGWLKGPQDAQCTDIHYRSLTGEGNFNWRYVFSFDYLTAEEKIVISRKETLFSWDETESKIPARLELQVWDADHFSADDFLGSLTLDLTNFPRGAKSSKLCTLAMLNPEADVPVVNIFKQKRAKGWWPFQAKNEHGEIELTGKVEAEIHLLTQEEAEANPVGLGRNEPDALEKPSRPDSSFVWFLNPLKSMRYILWHNYKWMIVKLLIVFFVILLVILFVYSIPGYMAKRMVNA